MDTVNLALTEDVLPQEALTATERRADKLGLVDQTAAGAGDGVGHWVRTAFQARQDGRAADAPVLLAAAAERFPTDAQVQHDLARLEEAGQNWPAAERAWQHSAINPWPRCT